MKTLTSVQDALCQHGFENERDKTQTFRKKYFGWMNLYSQEMELLTVEIYTSGARNPKLKRSSIFQVKISVKDWAGLIDNILLGPIILLGTLIRERFVTLLRDELSKLLADVPLALRQGMYLQMDGCPAHNASQVRSLLNENYTNKLIGRQGLIGWPARFPDMKPLDYFLGNCEATRLQYTN
jgi:hypothetical protein